MKYYTLVYDNSYFDDLDIQIVYDTLDNLKELVKSKNLSVEDYAIIDGCPVKTFDNKKEIKHMTH